MSEPLPPRIGPGAFQWNRGGWFGGVLGGTAWMIVVAGFLVSNRQIILAIVPIGGFVMTNAIAFRLWKQRGLVDPFPALVTLFSVLAIVLPATWMIVEALASRESLAQMDWPTSFAVKIPVFVIMPVTIAWFFVLEYFAKSEKKKTTGEQTG